MVVVSAMLYPLKSKMESGGEDKYLHTQPYLLVQIDLHVESALYTKCGSRRGSFDWKRMCIPMSTGMGMASVNMAYHAMSVLSSKAIVPYYLRSRNQFFIFRPRIQQNSAYAVLHVGTRTTFTASTYERQRVINSSRQFMLSFQGTQYNVQGVVWIFYWLLEPLLVYYDLAILPFVDCSP